VSLSAGIYLSTIQNEKSASEAKNFRHFMSPICSKTYLLIKNWRSEPGRLLLYTSERTLPRRAFHKELFGKISLKYLAHRYRVLCEILNIRISFSAVYPLVLFCFNVITIRITHDQCSFLPMNLTDGGVTLFRHPSRLQQRLNRIL